MPITVVSGPGSGSDPILNIVQQGVLDSRSKTDQAFFDANDLMDDMRDLVNTLANIPDISTQLDPISSTVTPWVQPTTPVEPNFDPAFPASPAPAVTGTVDPFTLSATPVFTAAEPVTNPITPPAAFTRTAPVEPSLDTHTNPLVPDDTLPVPPTIRQLTLPATPSLLPVTFDGAIPGALRAPPNTTFNYTNTAYQSALSTALKTKLLDLVNNARQTGLLPAIEDQIWGRGRERTAAEERRLKAAARRQYAAMGFNLPPGDEILMLRRATEQAVANDITESRSIAIAQAELEQKNLHFSIQSAISLEGQLIDLHNAEQQRLFEAARYTIEAAVQLYGLEVSYFNANVGLYETQARVFQSRIQAQLAEVEVYKAQLEGQKIIGELNQQDIEIYKAKIDAVLATFTLYKSKLEGVKILLEGDSLKLQRFEASVRAFAEEVRAKSLENEIYRSQLDGEKIKVDMYNGLSAAFRNRIEGFKIETDAKVAKQDADIKIAYDVPLKIADQKAEIYKSVVSAESERLKALSSIFETRGRVFESLTRGEASRVEAEVKAQENEINKVISKAQIELDAFSKNVSKLLAEKEMLIGIQKTIAQVKAQLAASFGSAINYHAGLSASESVSVNHSFPHAEQP